jgi:hypothetical protein
VGEVNPPYNRRRFAGTGIMRLIGVLFLALALVIAVLDWRAAGTLAEFEFRLIGDLWFLIDKDSLQLLQPALERHVAPWLWDPVMLTLLTAPAAPLAAAVGLVFFILPGLLR